MKDPQFVHDCQQCQYLGQHDSADLYFCEQGGYPTVIARFSDQGSDYTSGFDSLNPILIEAKRRAFEFIMEKSA